MSTRYYSLRRLAPYQGVVQVIQRAGFRALSEDGVTWHLQITQAGSRFTTYGTWVEGGGHLLETPQTAPLLEALHARPALPFPPADSLELWLLDKTGQLPLALVLSTFADISPPQLDEVQWLAAVPGEQRFVAESLGAQQAGAGSAGFPHAEVVRRCVAAAADGLPQAQWFWRQADGSGLGAGGCRIDDVLKDRKLPPEAFPELLVRETGWSRERDALLIREFHNWLAPDLLVHSGLSISTRQRLEQAACTQPARLYRLRRVLPEVIDEDRLKTAFVAAVIAASSGAADDAGR